MHQNLFSLNPKVNETNNTVSVWWVNFISYDKYMCMVYIYHLPYEPEKKNNLSIFNRMVDIIFQLFYQIIPFSFSTQPSSYPLLSLSTSLSVFVFCFYLEKIFSVSFCIHICRSLCMFVMNMNDIHRCVFVCVKG